ncbi:hypothetical protein LOTGIDRAFT_234105 [Lottia gigantea]|uniref:Apple domain-containing protein n=1 Tax=Lottia gigantea TaxID=225164 RepID=V3ZEW9_LOTGI|nr:hypothetical protein LOTGIDRAFT_234105 [Lottia gigantea]ESO89698.1 hypothetical protein LOTGIDRAFT_234105 [Lottia gigantea]
MTPKRDNILCPFVFMEAGEPTVGVDPLRVWQLSNNTYGYRSDEVPPIYPQGNFCGQFGEGPASINFPFQAISFDATQSSFIDVELNNSDISEDWSLTLHLYPRHHSGNIGIFSYSSTSDQGVTDMKLILHNGMPRFMMSYNDIVCGTAKSPAQLPLNTWSFLSLHRRYGQLVISVNTTRTQGSDDCQYGLHGPPNGILKIAAIQGSTYISNFDGMMECFIVYNEFVQTVEVTRGETACSSSSIQQPDTESFHSCGQTGTSATPRHYILDHINYSPDLSTSSHNITARSITECAKFCSCSISCSSFSLKKGTIGHSCFLFDFIADGMALSGIPDFRYYIPRYLI